MIFDLRGARFGDVLLAAPAMREGDIVVTRNDHCTLRSLPVIWLRQMPHTDDQVHRLAAEAGEHLTDYWLRVTGRTPVRHSMQIETRKAPEDTVIAPCIKHGKHWGYWHALNDVLMKQGRNTVMIGSGLPRWQWIESLALAKVVIVMDTDTAYMADHIGAARVVGLYDEHQWQHRAPYWDRSHCIVRGDVDDITVEDVLEKVNG